MATTKRTKAERERDLAELAELLPRGATYRQLAARFGLSLAQIAYDVRDVEQRWRETATKEIATWKGVLLARHDAVIVESWREWERSKADAEKHVEVTELMDDIELGGDALAARGSGERLLEVKRRTTTTSGRTGDPRYLAVIEGALAEQAKIIGANAAQELKHDATESFLDAVRSFGAAGA